MAILDYVIKPTMWHGIIDSHLNSEENTSSFTVSTVPADTLAPTGARASAGTVLTKVRSHFYKGPVI